MISIIAKVNTHFMLQTHEVSLKYIHSSQGDALVVWFIHSVSCTEFNSDPHSRHFILNGPRAQSKDYTKVTHTSLGRLCGLVTWWLTISRITPTGGTRKSQRPGTHVWGCTERLPPAPKGRGAACYLTRDGRRALPCLTRDGRGLAALPYPRWTEGALPCLTRDGRGELPCLTRGGQRARCLALPEVDRGRAALPYPRWQRARCLTLPEVDRGRAALPYPRWTEGALPYPRWQRARCLALPEVDRGRAALPEVDSPDVLLDAGSCVQHLATAFPKAFEHHLHGVLQEEVRTTSPCKQVHPVSLSSPLRAISFARSPSS
jgi:hypothetical protein